MNKCGAWHHTYFRGGCYNEPQSRHSIVHGNLCLCKIYCQDGVKSAGVHGVFINHPALIDQTTVIDNRAGNDSAGLAVRLKASNLFMSRPDLVPAPARAVLRWPFKGTLPKNRGVFDQLMGMARIPDHNRHYRFSHINPIVPHPIVMVFTLSPDLTVKKAPGAIGSASRQLL